MMKLVLLLIPSDATKLDVKSGISGFSDRIYVNQVKSLLRTVSNIVMNVRCCVKRGVWGDLRTAPVTPTFWRTAPINRVC
jgi:hypothetical protein